MRKAAEAIDDRLVRQRVARPPLVPQLPDQMNGERLILAILAVLEGEVDKELFVARHCDIESSVDGEAREPARDGVGGKGAWCAPEHVARKLIHYDHGGEHWAWCGDIDPIALHELPMQRSEAMHGSCASRSSFFANQ